MSAVETDVKTPAGCLIRWRIRGKRAIQEMYIPLTDRYVFETTFQLLLVSCRNYSDWHEVKPIWH